MSSRVSKSSISSFNKQVGKITYVTPDYFNSPEFSDESLVQYPSLFAWWYAQHSLFIARNSHALFNLRDVFTQERYAEWHSYLTVLSSPARKTIVPALLQTSHAGPSVPTDTGSSSPSTSFSRAPASKLPSLSTSSPFYRYQIPLSPSPPDSPDTQRARLRNMLCDDRFMIQYNTESLGLDRLRSLESATIADAEPTCSATAHADGSTSFGPDDTDLSYCVDDVLAYLGIDPNTEFEDLTPDQVDRLLEHICTTNHTELQSGLTKGDRRRDARDRSMRDAAIKQTEATRKLVPKSERAGNISSKREAQTRLREQLQDPDNIRLNTGRSLISSFSLAPDKPGPLKKILEALTSSQSAHAALIAAAISFSFLAGRVARKGGRAIDGLSSIIDGIRNFGDQLKGFLKHMWYVPLVVVILHFLKEWDAPLIVSGVLSFLPKFLGSVWNHVAEFFHPGNIQLQAGADDFSKLLSTAFTFSVFKGRFSQAKVSEFCKRIGSIDRQAKGWEALIDWTMSAFEKMVNFARVRFGQERVTLFSRADASARAWALAAETFLSEEATGKETDPARLDLGIRLLQEGSGLKELYRGTDVARYVDTNVARLTLAISPYIGSIGSRHNFRFEPVAIFFYGPPGIGKTLFSVLFVTDRKSVV